MELSSNVLLAQERTKSNETESHRIHMYAMSSMLFLNNFSFCRYLLDFLISNYFFQILALKCQTDLWLDMH